MMSTRHFKNENSPDELIKVSISNAMITIRLLDSQTKEIKFTNTYVMTEISYWSMMTFVYQLVDTNQAEEIMNHIELKSEISNRLFKNR